MSAPNGTRFNAKTHVGLIRKINEDSILALPEHGIWVVSDGMGGHKGGDFASQSVVEAISMLDEDLPPRELMQGVRGAIERAHQFILQEADRIGAEMIGATVVTLILSNSHFVAFWAGDSRLYRLREGAIEMLSTDHSIVASLVLSGQLSWDEAEHHPQSNAITRAVGVGEKVELDKIRGEAEPGDRFLLCSDGLTKYTDMGTLQRILGEEPIETVSDTLLDLALRGGGADNISIIVVDVPEGTP